MRSGGWDGLRGSLPSFSKRSRAFSNGFLRPPVTPRVVDGEPGVRDGLVYRKVARIVEVNAVRGLQDAVGVTASDLDGGVRAPVVDDDDRRRPADQGAERILDP